MDLGYGCILPSARPQLPISNWHQPRQPPARVGGSLRLSLMWKPLALLILLVVAASPLQAQSPDPTAGVPLCDRTEQVQDAIVAAVDGVSNCADVTKDHLLGITQLLLADESIGALQVGDFSGLAQLETLDLSGNSLSALPVGVLADVFGLVDLDLSGNSLSALPAGVLADFFGLEVLDLGGNSLSALPADVFADLVALEVLHLGGNGLTALPAGVFGGLTLLRSLNLNENLLAELPPAVFNGLGALDTLRLQENLLTTLPVGVFSDLAALVTLLLNDNLLTGLPPGIFNGLSALHDLHLYDNSLTALPAGLFSDLRELKLLSLNDNSLTALPARLFSDLRVLETLFLQGNPGSEDFLPTANAGADQSIGAGHIVTLTATASDADPWGDNVRYAWAQIDNSGDAVDLMGIDTAHLSFYMPADATALEFELTVTGRGVGRDGARHEDTDRVTVRLPASVVTLSGPEHELLPKDATAIAGDVLSLVYSYSADDLRGRVLTGSIEVAAAIDSLAVTSAIEVDEVQGRGEITVVLRREKYPYPGEHELTVTLSLGAAAEGFALGGTSSITTAFSFLPLPPTVLEVKQAEGNQGKRGAAGSDTIELGYIFEYAAGNRLDRPLAGLSVQVDIELCADAGYGECSSLPAASMTLTLDDSGSLTLRVGRTAAALSVFGEADADSIRHGRVLLSTAGDGDFAATAAATTFSFAVADTVVTLSGPVPVGATGISTEELSLVYSYSSDDLHGRVLTGSIEVAAAIDGVAITPSIEVDEAQGRGEITVILQRLEYPEPGEHELAVTLSLSAAATGFVLAEPSSITTPFSFGALVVPATVVTLSGPVPDPLPEDAAAIVGDVLSLIYSYSADDLRGRVLTGSIEVAAAIDGLAVTPAIEVDEDEGRGEITVVLRREKYPYPGEHELTVTLSLGAAAEGFVLGGTSSITTAFSFLPFPPTVLEVGQAEGNEGKRGAAGSDTIELGYIFEYAAGNRLNRPRAGLSVQVDFELCTDGGYGECSTLPAASMTLTLDDSGSLTLRVDRTAAALSVFGEADDDSIRHGRVLLSTAGDGDFAAAAATTTFSFAVAAAVVTLSGPVPDPLPEDAAAIVGDVLSLVYSYSADDLRGRALTGSIEVAAAIDGLAVTPAIEVDEDEGRGRITVILRREKYPYPGEHQLAVILSLGAAAEGFVLGGTSSITTAFSFLPFPPTVLEVGQAEGNEGKRGAAGSDTIELGYIFEYAADNRLNRPRAGLSVQIDIELCAAAGGGCAILPGASQALMLDGDGSLALRVDRTLAALSVFGEADDDSIRHGRVLLSTAGDGDFAAAAATTTFSFAIAAAVVTLSGPVPDPLPEDAAAIVGDVLSLVYSYSADDLRGRALTGSIEVAAAIDGLAVTPAIEVDEDEGRGEITVVLRREKYPYPGEHELTVTLSLGAAAEGFVLGGTSSITTAFSFLPFPPTVLEVGQAEGNEGKRGAAGSDTIELGYIFEYAAGNRLNRPRAGLSVQVDFELCTDGGYGECSALPAASMTLTLDDSGSLTLRVDRTAAALSVFGEADDDSIRHGRVLLSTAGDGDFAAAAATTTFSFAVAAAVVTLSGPVPDPLPEDAAAIVGDVLSLVYSYSADDLRGRVLTGSIEVAAAIDGLAVTSAIEVDEVQGRGEITVVLRREKYPYPGEHELTVTLSLGAAAEGFVLGGTSSITTAFSFLPFPPTVLEVGQAEGNEGKRGAAGSDTIELGYIFEYAADNRLNRPRAGLSVQIDIELCAAAGGGCAILPGASQALMLDGDGSLALRVDRTLAALSVFGEADDDSIRHGRVLLSTAGDGDFAAAAATTTFSFAIAAAVVTLSGPVPDPLPEDAAAIVGDVLSLVYSYSADDLRGRVP